MVDEATNCGLVVATSAERSAPLDELLAGRVWSVITQATPGQLHQVLSLHAPELVLFWLDAAEQTLATATLIAWLRERQPWLYRVAVAYELELDVELVIRAAGVHRFFATARDVGGLDALSTQLVGLRHSGLPAETQTVVPVKVARRPRFAGELISTPRPP